MAMNKQRRTSNLNNIVRYDTSGNVSLPAGLTVEGLDAGFVKSDANGLFSIDTGAYLPTPSQSGNAGKYLTTDGSVLSWGTVSTANIYNSDGSLTGNRVVTLDANRLVFKTNQSLLQNYTYTVGNPTGTSALSGPVGISYEGEYLMTTASNFGATPIGVRAWGRNQTGSPMTLRTVQVNGDITSESTGITSIINGSFVARRGSPLDTSTTAVFAMYGAEVNVGAIYTGSSLTTAPIVTTTQAAVIASITNNTGTIVNAYPLRSWSFTASNTNCLNTAITNYYGLSVEATVGLNGGTWTAAITNYYGVFLAEPSIRTNGIITNRWGVYAPDAAMRHHINGNVLIGTTTDAGYKFDVQGTARVSAEAIILGQIRNNAGNFGNQSSIFIRTTSETGHAATFNKGSYSHINTLQFLGNDGTQAFSLGQGRVGNENSLDFIFTRYVNPTWTEVYRIPNSTGNFLLNTATDAGFKLDVFGTVRLYPRGAINGGFEFTFNDVYNIMHSGSHTYLSANQTMMVGAGNNSFTFIGVNKDDYITPVLIGYNSWQSNISSASAILDVRSTTRGFLQPRMTTTQRDTIATPATGLSVYNTTTNTSDFYNGSSWISGGINIYNSNGTLTGNRAVTLGGYKLSVGVPTTSFASGSFELGINVASAFSQVIHNTNGGGAGAIVFGASDRYMHIGMAGTSLAWPVNGAAFIHNTYADLYFTGGSSAQPGTGDVIMTMFRSTKNITIGGTTDAGFKLDVQGTARVTGDALVNGLTVGRGGGNVSGNTVLGETSGTSFTTGSSNVAIGFRALTSITTQTSNIAVGTDALRFAVGSYNISMSYESGYSLTGSHNIGIGYQTLKVTTADGNIGIGQTALRANTTGAYSVAVGAEALLSNTTGGSNTAIGTQALVNNNGGSNVAVGYQTMYSSGASQRSVVIGTLSGWNITSSDNNVFVGYNTGRGITTGRANTILGSVQGLTSTLSNNIILADGDGNIRIRAFDTGNVTINSGTDAGYKLDVAGTGRFTNTLSVITTGTTNEVALFKSTEPYITIEAAGGSNSASIFLKPSTSSQNATIQNRTGGGLEFYTGATPSLSATITAANNLVIGTVTAATQKVQITSTSGDNHLLVWGSTSPSIRIDNAATGSTQRFVLGLATATNNFITGSVAGDICMTTQSSSPLLFGANATEVMRISTSLNLLIGTNIDSGYKLDVQGSGRFTGEVGVKITPTSSAILRIQSGSTSQSQIRLESSTAPTSPSNGDIWFDGSDIKMRIGGVTKTFTLV